MTNRFKGLDLIDRMPDELWTEVHDSVHKVVIKTIPKKEKCKKANGLCKIVSQWEFAVWLRKLKQGRGINLEGWNGEGVGREFQKPICIPMADSC